MLKPLGCQPCRVDLSKVNIQSVATIIGPRPMRPKQRTHHDGHRHPEADNENLRSVKRTMSLKEIRSIHEEGKAEFNKARSESTNTRLENVRRALNPPPVKASPTNSTIVISKHQPYSPHLTTTQARLSLDFGRLRR